MASQTAFAPPDAWTRAVNRFTEDLDDDEKHLFFQASPETILYEASAAEKTQKSKTRHFLEKIQPCIESIEDYGRALDVFANTYPLVMSPLWGSIRIVLHLANEASHYFERIVEMFTQISDLLPRLHVYEALFPDHERLVQALSLVYSDIINFCSEAKHALRKPKRAMFGSSWKTFKRQFGHRIESFNRHQRSIDKEVDVSHMIESAKTTDQIQANQLEVAKERKAQDVWQTIASLSTVNYTEQLSKSRAQRHDGTGGWIIHENLYREWKENPHSTGLCCCGIPGSGKTVLTSKIIDDLANGDSVARPVIYYYYEYEDRPTLETRSVYGTLLKQLFIDGLVPNGILDEFVEKCASDRHPPHDQYLSRLLLKVVEGISKLFVIIDGLDECDENSQQTVCDTLSLFAAIPTSAVKILVTCRNEERPLKYLQSFQKLQITPAATFEDIQRFITAEVKTKIMRQELTLRNPALELYIVDELTAKAQGMFLWVHFQIQDLCEAASDSAIREILKNLPRGLDQTYLRIIKKIDSSMNRDLARMTLRWVAIARRPLNIEELQEAVAFDKDDRHWDEDKIPNGEKLLQACYGLVIRDEANKAHYAHHTVQQFLTSPESEEDNVQLPLSHYLCFKEDLEHMAAEVCVTYLCFSDFESALIKSEAERRVLVNDVFKHGGPIAIPAALGLRRSLIKLPIRLFGSSNFNIPQVDFAQYANPARLRKWPRPDLLKKYDYIVQFWPWHTNPALPSMRPFDTQETRTSRTRLPTIPENQRPSANQVQTIDRLWNLIFNKTLTFEVRPWGPNQHFGPYGCKGCPVPKDIQRPSLPFMALIHWAAGFGHFRLLMALGPDLSPHLLHEEYHQETLLIACRHGHERIVLLLLQSFDHDLGDGRAMWEACAYSQIGSLELLLRYHKSYGKHYYRPSYYVLLSKHGSERLTLLQYAAQQGSNAVFELLISQLDESYAQMDQDFGKTELRYAIKGGSVDIVNLILKSPTTLPVQDLVSYQIEYGETPLILASMLRNAPVVRALLAAGAPTERTSTRFLDVPVQVQKWVHGGMLPAYDSRSNPSPDYKGAAAIHFAIHENNADVLQLLPNIEQSCKCVVRLAGREDYSLEYIELRPLHLAAAYGRTECAEVLLAKGANIDVPCDDVGMTPLHFAAMRSGRELVEALLRYDADSLADDRFGHKPLGYAISSGNASILALLLGKLKDEQRLSAMLEQDSGLLCSAVMWNHIEAVKLLSQELANPKITDSRTVAWEIRRSLSDAISSPHVKDDIIRVLVGVQPEILTHNHKIDDHGDETFLDRAVLSQNEARVKLLLELGAGDRYPTVGTYLQSMVPIALSLAIDNVSPACCSVLLTSKMYKPLSYVRKNAYDYAKTLYQERKLASRFKGKADQRRILELLKEGVEHDWDHI